MRLKSVKDANLKGKRVLLKVDYDTPTSGEGTHQKIVDDTRIRLTLPTIHYLLKQKTKIIILPKRGRPDGKVDPRLRLNLMAKRLQQLLGHPVTKLDETVSPRVRQYVSKMKPKDVVMLENIRFLPGETTNDPQTARELASLGDIIVNDAFSLAHRAHASAPGTARFIPMVAGFHLMLEFKMLTRLTHHPKRPFITIVGGAKISDKVDAVRNLSRVADAVLVGGGVANSFLKAEGVDVLKSFLQDTIVDETKRHISFVALAKKLLYKFRNHKLLLHGYIPIPKIVAPIDVIAADKLRHPSITCTLNFAKPEDSNCPDKDLMFLDIGSATIKLYQDIIKEAKTIFWNGPMGVFEESKFAHGTKQVALSIANSRATTILGGGDTIAAITKFKLKHKYDYVSAAGGAALEFLSGKLLPGLKPMITTR